MDDVADGNSGPGSFDSEYDDELAISEDVPSPVLSHSEERKNLDTIYNFRSLYKEPVKFKSPHRRNFIPDEEISLHIIDYERSITAHFLYPNLYTIQLRHGDFTWTVKRRYNHISHLHQQLRIFRATLKIPIPTKSHREIRSSFKQQKEQQRERGGNTSLRKMPRFPSKPEALVPVEQLTHRMKQLEEYLRNLLKIKIYRNHYEVANFFEISPLSFIYELGDKGMEGVIKKRTQGARLVGCNCCGCLNKNVCVRCSFACGDVCGSWRKRWFIVKNSFVAYINPATGRIRDVILFDSVFEVSSGIFPSKVLLITNLSRQIVIKCPTRRAAREWQHFLRETIRNEGADFTQRNRYMSFVPPRPGSLGCWLTDGCAYMYAVAAALEQAKQEIFIADWWLSPEIQLRRPQLEQKYRLDRILQRKAEEGVKIFILLYKEVEMALGINSFYSKQRLISDCKKPENLKILRHPDHAKAGVFFWTHHEKIVVIDQTLAFVGGIDLCYGRWDDHRHRLTDVGWLSERKGEYRHSLPSLQDNDEERVKRASFISLGSSVISTSLMLSLKLTDLGRSPEEDMASFLSLAMSTNALTSSLISVNINEDRAVSCEELMMQPSPENIKCNTPEQERKSIFDTVRERMSLWNMRHDSSSDDDETDDARQKSLATESTFLSDGYCNGLKPNLDVRCNEKLWIGKDYTNFILKDFENLDRPFEDLVDRSKTARMPWHDLGVMVHGAPARDIARHFIHRWNSVKVEKAKLNNQYPYLLPKAYRHFSEFWIPELKRYKINCQVVRSVSHWSCGSLDPNFWERSIHEAYIDVINKSEHYIYIENQFFVTGGQARNQVGDALVKRIIKAHREHATFRVYVILPLLPGFEGEIGTSRGAALHAVTHWNYVSICRGKTSLLSRLKDAGISDPSEYITFHGLRTYAELNNTPVTELIYVHSKLLIADDKVMICGSANINDRSLLGTRDSEIAVVIEDEEFKPGRMGGKEYMSGLCCGSLRRALFREHLGISGPKVKDPTCSEFYHGIWRKIAEENTKIYEEVFHCLPSNEVTRFADIKNPARTPVADLKHARELLQGIQGYLVMFPLDFLKEESLVPNGGQVERLLPTSVWT